MATALGAAVQSSMPMVRNSVEAGADAVMTDDPAESGDCGDMVDVVSEGRSASVLQERGVGGLRAPSRYAVQDVALGSAGGAASVGDAVPLGSGIDVEQPSADGLGDGGTAEQDTGASQASSVFYGAAEEAAQGETGLGRTDGGYVVVAVQDRLSLIIIRHSLDDEESDDEWDDSLGVASSGSDLALHQPGLGGTVCL